MLRKPSVCFVLLATGLLLCGRPGGLWAQDGNEATPAQAQPAQFALACAALFRGLADMSANPAYLQAGFAAGQAGNYGSQSEFWEQHLQSLGGDTLQATRQTIGTRLPQVVQLVNNMAQAQADERNSLLQRVNQQISRCNETREQLQPWQGTLVCQGMAAPEGIQYNPVSPHSGSGARVTQVFVDGSLYYSSADLRIAIPANRMLFASGVSVDAFAGDSSDYPLHIDIHWIDESLAPNPKPYLQVPAYLNLAMPAIQRDNQPLPLGRVSLKRGMQTPVVAPLHFASYTQTYGNEPNPRPFVSDVKAARGIWPLLLGEAANLELRWGSANQAYIQAMVPGFSMQPYLQLLEAAQAVAAAGDASACQAL